MRIRVVTRKANQAFRPYIRDERLFCISGRFIASEADFLESDRMQNVEKEEIMLGLSDPSILLAYLLSLGGAVLCIVYGIVNWNKGNGESTGGGKK